MALNVEIALVLINSILALFMAFGSHLSIKSATKLSAFFVHLDGSNRCSHSRGINEANTTRKHFEKKKQRKTHVYRGAVWQNNRKNVFEHVDTNEYFYVKMCLQ